MEDYLLEDDLIDCPFCIEIKDVEIPPSDSWRIRCSCCKDTGKATRQRIEEFSDL